MSAAEIVLVVFGAIGFAAIGSFTAVIIDRLPLALDEPNQYGELWDTKPWSQVLGGHSRCSSCGQAVGPLHNIPIFSWLALRGKCKNCSEPIPAYLLAVETASPILFLLAVWSLGADWRLLPAIWFIPVALAVTVIDIQTFMVPTRIVWPAFFVSVALAVLSAGLEAEWRWLLGGLIGIAVLAGPLFAIWFAFPRGMGFGDVRLATLVGFNVGFFAGVGRLDAVMLSILALAIASLVGVILGFAALGVRGRKAKVPFGPPLLAAGYFCMLLAPQILSPFGF